MIHHLARAFAVRHNPNALAASGVDAGKAQRPSSPQPVRPRPITPWGSQPREGASRATTAAGRPAVRQAVRITVDPQDARRTVIAGRFAEVCAALDRLVLEQEALA